MATIAYADPPYLGCCRLYGHEHGDDDLCWDDPQTHALLLARLNDEYDGYAYSMSSPSVFALAHRVPVPANVRMMAWVKPFAAFKRNVPVAYAWEPLLVKAARKPVVSGRIVMRDWIAESITLKRGFTGAKPEAVCRWMFEVLGAKQTDEFSDLYSGSGAVGRAWEAWRTELRISEVS